MKTQDNRILTFLNIAEPIETIVESTVNLAETFNAEVSFFYVQKQTDSARTENQLSLMRTMAEEQKAIQKLKNIIANKQKQTSLNLGYTIEKGHVKKTILSKIDAYQPDLIVLGKRAPSAYRVIGNQTTEFVLKNFDGPVFIAHPSKVLKVKENLSMGVLNNVKTVEENSVTSTLIERSKEPLKLFKIEDASTSEIHTGTLKTIDYTFENNENALKSLTSYVHKNNVNLLCLERSEKQKTHKNVKLKQVLKHMNTSMLMVASADTNNLMNS